MNEQTERVVSDMARSLLPVLLESNLDMSYVHPRMIALCLCLSGWRGPCDGVSGPARLSAWQENSARQYMLQHLHERILLDDVAGQCNLSRSYFGRAFKNSIGVSVNTWLQQQRIDLALTLLGSRRVTISDIATACGFFDQSHFSRVFKKMTGTTPGAWLRENVAQHKT